jgi:PAS domain-containing protein
VVRAGWKDDLASYPKLEIRPRIYEVRCKGGAFRTILFRPVTLPTGKQLIIYEDITERKQAEQEQRQMNTLLDSVIENIPDMIFLKDAANLRFVRLNRAGEDLLGYSRNLKEEEICLEARILAVADVMEAMASHRPYRPGLGIDAALNEIEQNSGIFYDNAAATACLRLFREKSFKLEVT